MNPFKSKTKKQWSTWLCVAAVWRNVMDPMFVSVFSLMSCLFLLFLHFTVIVFCCFWIWHNPFPVLTSDSTVSHQGGIQTLSISHSNSCIWQVPVRHPNAFQLSVKTPPCLPPRCCLSRTPPHPTPSHSIPTKAPPFFPIVVFSPNATFEPSRFRVDSTPLKLVIFDVPQVCTGGVQDLLW